MTIIRYNALKKHINESTRECFPYVYLLYGDEFLYKTALGDILDAIVPTSRRSTNCESIEGTVENIHDVIEKVNTFSLIPGRKAIVASEAKFFYSKVDIESILEKSKQAFDENDMRAASTYLVKALNLLQLSFDEIASEEKNKKLNMDRMRLKKDFPKTITSSSQQILQTKITLYSNLSPTKAWSWIVLSQKATGLQIKKFRSL
jgi:DNA polymerase-3 subunit delta